MKISENQLESVSAHTKNIVLDHAKSNQTLMVWIQDSYEE